MGSVLLGAEQTVPQCLTPRGWAHHSSDDVLHICLICSIASGLSETAAQLPQAIIMRSSTQVLHLLHNTASISNSHSGCAPMTTGSPGDLSGSTNAPAAISAAGSVASPAQHRGSNGAAGSGPQGSLGTVGSGNGSSEAKAPPPGADVHVPPGPLAGAQVSHKWMQEAALAEWQRQAALSSA